MHYSWHALSMTPAPHELGTGQRGRRVHREESPRVSKVLCSEF